MLCEQLRYSDPPSTPEGIRNANCPKWRAMNTYGTPERKQALAEWFDAKTFTDNVALVRRVKRAFIDIQQYPMVTVCSR